MEEVSRTYRHKACGGETTVSGKVLRALATPILPPSLTKCAACGKSDLVNNFIWTHTEENIDQALDRILKELPLPIRFVTNRLFLLTSLLLSVGVGIGVGQWDRWWTGLLAGIGCFTVLSVLVDGIGHLFAKLYRIEFEKLL